jgi:hypothetical protein
MNALERLLQDDLNHLIDRIATTPEGLVGDCAARRPDLAAELGAAETRISLARQRLLQGYAEWRDSLAECADLWALATLASEPLAERRAA